MVKERENFTVTNPVKKFANYERMHAASITPKSWLASDNTGRIMHYRDIQASDTTQLHYIDRGRYICTTIKIVLEPETNTAFGISQAHKQIELQPLYQLTPFSTIRDYWFTKGKNRDQTSQDIVQIHQCISCNKLWHNMNTDPELILVGKTDENTGIKLAINSIAPLATEAYLATDPRNKQKTIVLGKDRRCYLLDKPATNEMITAYYAQWD